MGDIQYRCSVTGMYPEEEEAKLKELKQQVHKLSRVIEWRKDVNKVYQLYSQRSESLLTALKDYQS